MRHLFEDLFYVGGAGTGAEFGPSVGNIIWGFLVLFPDLKISLGPVLNFIILLIPLYIGKMVLPSICDPTLVA